MYNSMGKLSIVKSKKVPSHKTKYVRVGLGSKA